MWGKGRRILHRAALCAQHAAREREREIHRERDRARQSERATDREKDLEETERRGRRECEEKKIQLVLFF